MSASAITVAAESSIPSPPIVIDVQGDISDEVMHVSAEQDGDLLARDTQAAADLGDSRRADALLCAQAVLAERRADDGTALALWRSSFDRDPTLLIAFWGLRRTLWRQGAWAELQGVMERRIAAIASHLGSERVEARAELWLDHGRIFEDRLHRDDDAAQSYRAGLIEAPDHPGLLIALLLLGARRSDAAVVAEALAGLLQGSLPPALRASMSAALARIERTGMVSARGDSAPTAATKPPDASAVARAFETLHAALGAVGADVAGPLIDEVSALAEVTADSALRAAMLDELVSQLFRVGAPARPEQAALAAALLRERARLLRDHLDDPAGAAAALRAALRHAPEHASVVAELSDAIEMLAGDNVAASITGLRDLLALVAPADGRFETDAQNELALRYVTALARDGRAAEGLAVLERHPELPRERADVTALEILLRAATNDIAALAGLFEGMAQSMKADASLGPEAGAHALIVAGTLWERMQPTAAKAVTGKGHGAADGPGDGDTAPDRVYRRAIEWAPGYRPARDARERGLWAAQRWPALAEFLEAKLAHLVLPSAAAPLLEAAADTGAIQLGATAEDTLETCHVLEDLVAVCRDHLDDPARARAYQDQLLALRGPGADAAIDGTRARTRRHAVELDAAVHGQPSEPAVRVQILRELAAVAEVPALQSALRIEAARVAMGGEDFVTAEALLREALGADLSGAATAGLEGLAEGSDRARAATRADLVRDEIARLLDRQDSGSAAAARVRALRFRVAWHALAAERPNDALEALAPLRADGDAVARAWSWEIARRSGQAALQLAVLQAAPPASVSGLLELPTDLGEALERVGDLPAAEAGFREALRKEPSTEAALGLLRVGAALGNAAVVLEAARELAARAEASTAALLSQEVAMLALLQRASGHDARGGAGEVATSVSPAASPGAADHGHDGSDDPVGAVLRWAGGVRGANVLGAAAGLLALARALPVAGSGEAINDRNGLLARAAARARMGGMVLAGAVHDQVAALSAGAAPIGVGLADLPAAGRPERLAARIARAERNGGHLAYALDLECGLDAEARGDARAALDGFARAVGRDAEGIEALDGLKRIALSTGDRRGAARAGMRLGAVLRTSARAAAEFGMAGQLWEDLAMPAEAAVAYWQALARDPASEWLYERLRHLLGTQREGANLDRLYGHRLAVVIDPQLRLALLLERARHRLDRLDDRKAAIEDFNRMLKLDPHHRVALRYLATLAVQMEYFPQAVRFLERLLGREVDEERAAALRLELAEAYEAAREPTQAVEVLRKAASARPRDVAPWQRLIDLLLRIGDWSGALTTLRTWDTVLADRVARGEIWIRIGCLLRDHARDPVGASAAFATASDLDPLGDGVRCLVGLYGQSSGAAARRQALLRAISHMRRQLVTDPLDVPRLRRLKEMCEWLADGEGTAGAVVAGQLLELAGEDVALFSGVGRIQPRGPLGADFWHRLRVPGAAGFVAELWPLLADAAATLFPGGKNKSSQRERAARGSEPRLHWVEAAAAAVGIPALEMWLPRAGAAGREDGAVDESVLPIDGNEATLLLGGEVLTGNAAARFRVGRALVLLRERAVALDQMTAPDLAALFSAAAVVAGAAVPVAAGAVKSIDGHARALGKAMARKDRKALELMASRFAAEAIDGAVFREAVLATAERFGLILAGDVAVAARVTAGVDAGAASTVGAATIVANKRSLDLIGFALSDDYLALRQDIGTGEG